MDYLVTLSMPVYNVQGLIKRSLLSALNQTFESIEFLIVDDRGQDGSMDVVRQIQREHPRGNHIRIVEHKKNAGLGMTRNTAIDEAKGRFLFFMDSDDYIAPNTIQLMYDVMSREDVDIVAASDLEEVKGVIHKRYALPPDVERGEFAIAKWMEKTKLYFPIHTWNKLYKVDFLRKNNIRCIVGHMVEDTWFTFQVVMRAKSVASIADHTYFYYINPLSHSRQKRDEEFFLQYIGIFKARKQMIDDDNKAIPAAICNYFVDPFFSYFLKEAIDQKEKGDNCVNFINELKEIFSMKVPLSSLLNKHNIIIYKLLRKEKYKQLKYFYVIDDLKGRIYRALNKIVNFSKLPYHHL